MLTNECKIKQQAILHKIFLCRHPKQLINIIMPTKDKSSKIHLTCLENWKEQMTEAYKLAPDHKSKYEIKNLDRNNNSDRYSNALLPSDRMLIQIVCQRSGTSKMGNYWGRINTCYIGSIG